MGGCTRRAQHACRQIYSPTNEALQGRRLLETRSWKLAKNGSAICPSSCCVIFPAVGLKFSQFSGCLQNALNPTQRADRRERMGLQLHPSFAVGIKVWTTIGVHLEIIH